MRFTEKIKNFVKNHPVEIMIGVGGAVIFVCGAIVGAEIKSGIGEEAYNTGVAAASTLSGAIGMGVMARYVDDNIPEASKLIEEYASEHNTDFWKLFRECPGIVKLEDIIGREIPSPIVD